MSSISSSKRAQQAFIAQVSTLEKLGIASNLIITLAHTFSALFTTLFRGKDSKPPEFFKYITYTAYRTLARKMTPGQLQVVSPSTDDVYASACKKHNMKPDSIVLEDGTHAHWIGSSSAEKVIINFHGGGYVLPASPAFMEFMFILQSILAKENKDIAILFLSYDLAPGRVYPRQLQQAAALFSHVLNVLHKAPQNIVLTGDSAGGNLVLALMSHILHPHPSQETPIIPINMEAPLRGIVLLSPWVDFRITADSFKRNAYKDCIDKNGGRGWADSFMGHSRPYPNADNYNQAIQAPPSWWEGLKAEEVLIVAGEDEVLIDGIQEFATTLGKVESLRGKLQVVVTKGEAHDQPNMDVGLGYTTFGEQARSIMGFLSSRL